MTISKPQTQTLGTAIVDHHSDSYYLTLPDGSMNRFRAKVRVLKAIKAWAKQHTDADKISGVIIEWR